MTKMTEDDIKKTAEEAEKVVESLNTTFSFVLKFVLLPLIVIFMLFKLFTKEEEPKKSSWF